MGLFLADTDGSPATHDVVLAYASIDAVRRLRAEGVLFAVTSGQPPRGMVTQAALCLDPTTRTRIRPDARRAP